MLRNCCSLVLRTRPTGVLQNKAFSTRCLVRREAPQFTAKALVDGEFRLLKRDDFLGKYWLLFFYPLDFTFVCPTEIIAFSERVDEFKKLGCEVLAASVDSEFSHLAWSKQPRQAGGLGSLRIPLLSDLTKQIARDYGVLVEDAGIALRASFLIDQKGIIRHQLVNDTGIGRSVDESLRILQALQHVDKHGEVCPANWNPTQEAIDPKNATKYFSTKN